MADASWNSATKTLSLSGAATITADPGSADLPLVTANGTAAVLTISPAAAGTVVHLAELKLSGGAVARLSSFDAAPALSGRHMLVIENANGLAISGPGSKLDLRDNGAVLRGTGLAAVQALVTSAYNAGAWTGDGITSGVSATDPGRSTAVGYASGAQLAASTFAGVTPVGVGDVVVRYSYYGDTNLDRVVNTDDVLNILSAGKLDQDVPATWFEGDFTFDGRANTDDILQMLSTGQLDAQ
jgi:hypothetical protein